MAQLENNPLSRCVTHLSRCHAVPYEGPPYEGPPYEGPPYEEPPPFGRPFVGFEPTTSCFAVVSATSWTKSPNQIHVCLLATWGRNSVNRRFSTR